jgi:hypothetical protein
LVLVLVGGVVEQAGKTLLLPFQHSIKLKLVAVMVIFPLIFITLQFILTDSFIKKKQMEEDDAGVPQRFEFYESEEERHYKTYDI